MLYPMTPDDYFPIPGGTICSMPNGEVVKTVKNGQFLSDLYLHEVKEIGLEEIKDK